MCNGLPTKECLFCTVPVTYNGPYETPKERVTCASFPAPPILLELRKIYFERDKVDPKPNKP